MPFDPKFWSDINTKTKAREICRILTESGYDTFFVGGCVRDMILERQPKDYDIATACKPSEIQNIFSKLGYQTLEIGKAFGIITVVVENEPFEIATFREDLGSDGRHPDEVSFVSSITTDLSRRDFTINAIAYDPLTCTYIDPFNGKKDVEEKIIRFVGDPEERITEDYLRILRAFRFASTLSFKIEKDSLEAINYIVERDDNFLSSLSMERISEEFRKILIGDGAILVLDNFITNKLLFKIIPELERQLEPHNSPRWHNETWDNLGQIILSHTMQVMCPAINRTKHPNLGVNDDDKFIIRMGALLHDISKFICARNKKTKQLIHPSEAAQFGLYS
jgi:tRNA nucleotidyltransferase (CCA-adding enzyme)